MLCCCSFLGVAAIEERIYFLWVQITHMEMIKGIIGHGYYDELVVPIIENSAREYDLTDSLAAAVSYLSVITLDYPKP